jgi:hypothetical protein
VRHLKAHLHHVAQDVADLHPVADLERAPVDHAVAGDHVRHDGRRAERQHQAEEERQPLERLAVRPGDVRIGHDEGEGDDEDAGDAVRRPRPLAIEAAEADDAAVDALEEQEEEAETDPRQHEQDGEEDEIRQVHDEPRGQRP